MAPQVRTPVMTGRISKRASFAYFKASLPIARAETRISAHQLAGVFPTAAQGPLVDNVKRYAGRAIRARGTCRAATMFFVTRYKLSQNVIGLLEVNRGGVTTC